MSVVNVVAQFICDGCNKRFSIEIDIAKEYKFYNVLDMAIDEMRQDDDGEHFCVECWSEICKINDD